MAIEVKAPLADRLFALGSNVGPEDPVFKYKGQARGSYHGNLSMPTLQENPHEGGQAKGLASIGAALGAAWSQSASTPAATNEQGNGFGIGGNLASGEIGSGDYAGNRGLFSFGSEPQNAGQTGMLDDFRYGNQPAPDRTGLFNGYKYGSKP